MRLTRFQFVGSVGIALWALGGLFASVLPQLDPPLTTPQEFSWALFLTGGVLFWVGAFGAWVQVFSGAAEAWRAARREPQTPPK